MIKFIKYLIYNHRMKKALKFWNKNIPMMLADVEESTKLDSTKDHEFKWIQLVNQEIWFYCKRAEQIEIEDFNDLCFRRGFNENQKRFLIDLFKHAGLGKNL